MSKVTIARKCCLKVPQSVNLFIEMFPTNDVSIRLLYIHIPRFPPLPFQCWFAYDVHVMLYLSADVKPISTRISRLPTLNRGKDGMAAVGVPVVSTFYSLIAGWVTCICLASTTAKLVYIVFSIVQGEPIHNSITSNRHGQSAVTEIRISWPGFWI